MYDNKQGSQRNQKTGEREEVHVDVVALCHWNEPNAYPHISLSAKRQKENKLSTRDRLKYLGKHGIC